MIRCEIAGGAVFEKLMEFDRVAGLLEMPEAERLGILNVSEETYTGLRSGEVKAFQYVKPELERRLSYALPLMRRLASNSPVLHLPTGARRAAA